MFLTSRTPLRRRSRSGRIHRRGHSRIAAVERLEVRTLLSAVTQTFRTEEAAPFIQSENGAGQVTDISASVSLDVDFDVPVSQLLALEAELLVRDFDGGENYSARLEAPDGSSIPVLPDDAFVGGLFFDDITDFSGLTGSTAGTWVLSVSVETGDGSTTERPDLGELESAELRLRPPTGIRGVVFEDFDGDGIRDQAEPGLSFVDLNGNGELDEDGEQQFVVYVDLNSNRRFDEGEPCADVGEQGEYEILGLVEPGDYEVRLLTSMDGMPTAIQSALVANDIRNGMGPNDRPVRFTFADQRGQADSGGFLFGGVEISDNVQAQSRWQLTDELQDEANHSPDFAAVFGNVLPDGDIEPAIPGSSGELISPRITLPDTTDTLELQFKSFLKLQTALEIPNALSVSIILPDGQIQRLTDDQFGIGVSGGFTDQVLDLSAFRGQTVQIQFGIDIPTEEEVQAFLQRTSGEDVPNVIEAWFLDDIAVVQHNGNGPRFAYLPVSDRDDDDEEEGEDERPEFVVGGVDFGVVTGDTSVGGTVFSATSGDGLANQVVVYDRDDDGFDGTLEVYENAIGRLDAGGMGGQTQDDLPPLKVEIPETDGGPIRGTLIGAEISGSLTLRDLPQRDTSALLEFPIALRSPDGTLGAFFNVLAVKQQAFDQRELQVTLSAVLPDDALQTLRSDDLSGEWQVVVCDDAICSEEEDDSLEEALADKLSLPGMDGGPEARVTINSMSLKLVVARQGDAMNADRFVVTDTNGNWEFNGLRSDNPATMFNEADPLNFRVGLFGNPVADMVGTNSTLRTTFTAVNNNGLTNPLTSDEPVSVTTGATDRDFQLAFVDPDLAAAPEVIPFGGANNVINANNVTGEINYISDQDVFQIPSLRDGVEEALLTVSLITDLGALTPLNGQITVFTLDEFGQRENVTSNDDSLFLSIGLTDARLQFIADASETYFVEVAASETGDALTFAPRQETGAYRLTVMRSDAVDDLGGSEIPTADEAIVLPAESGTDAVHLTGDIDFASDRDLFRIEVPATDDPELPRLVQIDLEDLNSNLAAQLTVFEFDSQGELKEIFRQPADKAIPEVGSGLLPLPSLTLPVTDAGSTLIVQVSSTTTESSSEFGQPTGEYILSFEINEDSERRLRSVDPLGDRRASGTIDFSGDFDVFGLAVPNETSGFVEIVVVPDLNPRMDVEDLSFLDARFDVFVRDDEVIDENAIATGAKLVGSSDFDNAAFLTLELGREIEPGQDLLIVVSGDDGSQGRYEVTTRFVENDRDMRTLANGQTISTRINFAGDEDNYTITVPAGSQIVSLDVDRFDGNALIDSSDVQFRVLPTLDQDIRPGIPEDDADDIPESFVFNTEFDEEVSYNVFVSFAGLETGVYEITLTIEEGADDGGGVQTIVLEEQMRPGNGPTELAASETGQLERAADTDLFLLEVPASGLLEVELLTRGLGNAQLVSSDDIDLTITDPNNATFSPVVTSEVREDDDDDGPGGGSDGGPDDEDARALISQFAVDAGQTIQIAISSGLTTAEYELFVFLSADDELGSAGAIELSIDGRRDVDRDSTEGRIARVGTTATQVVRTESVGLLDIELQPEDGGLLGTLAIFRTDEDGNRLGRALGQQSATRTGERIGFSVPAGEGDTFVVEVGSAQMTTGDFELDFTLTAPGENDISANTLIDFDFGEPIEQRIDFGGDIDLFAFIRPNSSRVTVSVAPTESGIDPLDPEVAVFRAAGTDLRRLDLNAFDFSIPLADDLDSAAGLGAEIDFAVATGFIYLVAVRATNAVEGDYEITFNERLGDDFGDSLSSADPILLNAAGNISRDRNGDGDVSDLGESNQRIVGQLGDDDTDVFQFTSTVTRQLLIQANGLVSATGDSEIVVPELFAFEDGDLRQLIRSGTGEVVIDAVAGETYLVQLESQGETSGLYELLIQPSDTLNRVGVSLSTDPGVFEGSRTGEIERAGEADLFSIRTPISGRAVVELFDPTGDLDETNDGINANQVVSILDANFEEVAADDNDGIGGDGNNSRVEFNVLTRDLFFVRAGLTGDTTGDYELRVRIIPEQSIGADPGEILRDAGGLSFTESGNVSVATQSVTLSPVTPDRTDDTDTFSFVATETASVTVAVEGFDGVGEAVTGMTVLSQGADGSVLVVASGTGGRMTFNAVRGVTYAIQMTGLGTGTLGVVQTPITITEAMTFLPTSTGNATAETLAQFFTEFAASGQDFTGQQLLDAVLPEFFAAIGGQENLQDRFLILFTDPVDFVIESETTGSQAGFTRDQGQVDQYGNTFYSGDAVTELLVIPQADSGRYTLQLEGLGSDVRGGAALVSNLGTTTQTFEFQSLADRRVLTLDFPETERPAQVATVDDIEAPALGFRASVLLTALLGVDQQEGQLIEQPNNYRDSNPFLQRFFDLPGWDELPRVIGDVLEDLREFLPIDDLTDTDADELLPAVAPGMSGLTEAMSRFGELFGELLLPVVEESDNAAPMDNANDDGERTDERETPAPDSPPAPAGGDTGDGQASVPPEAGDAPAASRTATADSNS